MNIKPKTLIFIYFIITNLTLLGQTSFEFNGKKVRSGTKEHITVSISDGEDKAIIPITVFHGKKDGKVIGITAGVHGYEYAPILAGQKLIERINPANLNGTIILVQIANVASFLGRSPYTNPNDSKNLNRVFPGDPSGSITERIANFITKEVIARSDYFVDIHSGDAPEDLMDYAAYYQNDKLPAISEQGRQMVAHMGFDHIVVFKTTGKDYMKSENPSLYCSAEAFKQEIPSIDIECGRLGIIEPKFVDKITVGIESLLGYLSFTDYTPITTESIAYINERTSQSSTHTGFFYPNKSSGDYVKKGMKIGHITDFFGQTLQIIYAETSGIILYMLGTPPINKGETIVNIGQIK